MESINHRRATVSESSQWPEDLTDVRVLVGAEAIPNPGTGPLDPPEVERLYAWNAPVREEDVDLTVCSAGVVVPEPEPNPGLVEDCRILLGLRDELVGRGRLNWDAYTPIAEWQGIVSGRGAAPCPWG